jgi:carbamoyltransferase
MTTERRSGNVLGLQLSHDFAACLVRDGRVVAAIAEERLNRRKHFDWTPDYQDRLAIRYCLDAGGVDFDDLDAVVVSMVNFLQMDAARASIPEVRDARKIHLVGHHLAHAASAYYACGFPEAAILVMDGGGAFERGQGIELESMYYGHDGRIEFLDQTYARPGESGLCDRASLGWLYQGITIHLGFGTFDSGKTMGLAPYGTPGRFTDLVLMDGDGPRPNPRHIRVPYPQQGSNPEEFFHIGDALPRRHGYQPMLPEHLDLAADLQHSLEEAMVLLAQRLYDRTRCPNLCLAGGVTLNCIANKKILERTPFKRIFIQPAATDDGTALGGALYGWRDILGGEAGLYRMKNAYLGREYGAGRVEAAVRAFRRRVAVAARRDGYAEAAQRLADGQIVAWYQGGAEFGPRALGHRSILADPRRADMKDILNDRVKHREAFRPFAPAVPLERCREYFDLDCDSPFMLLAAQTKSKEVPAITHVDGTARVQTVTPDESREYYDMIQAFGKLTGVPVVLNTSFNVAGEPIVETPEDALRTFTSTAIDALVLGDMLLVKR